MKRTMKSLLALVLTVLMVVGTMTVAFAKNVDIADEGYSTCQLVNFGSVTTALDSLGSNKWGKTVQAKNTGDVYFYFRMENDDTLNAQEHDYSISLGNEYQVVMNNGNCWRLTVTNGNYYKITVDMQSYKIKVEDVSSPTEASTEAPTEATETTPTAPAGSINVYFTDNRNWGAAYCYTWDSSKTSLTGQWPGTQMTYVKNNSYGQKVYMATIPADTYGVIFNGGNATKQTVDITEGIENNAHWWCSNDENKYTVEKGTFTPEGLVEYKLSVNGTEYKFDSSMNVSATLNKDAENVVFINKYVDLEIDTTYYLSTAVSASDTSVTMTTDSNDNKFTAALDKCYFNFDVDTSTLSWAAVATKKICIQDNTSTNWLDDVDCDMYLTVDGGTKFILMTESVDTNTGLKTWYTTVDEPANGTEINFVRANRLYRYSDWDVPSGKELSLSNTDTKYVYNKFTATYNTTGDSSKGVYRVTSDSSAAWVNTTVNLADGSEGNYYYGIYVDTKGNGDTKDFVKFYTDSAITTSSVPTTYSLFLPSHVNLSSAKVYTTFYDCKIGDKDIMRGDSAVVNTVDLSGSDTYTVSYKQTSGAAAKSLTLKIYKTESTAAMMLTTKEDLYTDKLGSLKSNGWASDYKEAIADKGSYKLFDESGSQVNSDTGLKKIKGRGNSSWEASMELYGKYAYNMTTTEKAKLISGATASKKYCLMANNMDESALRNTLVYAIAEEAGCLYVPKTRLVDLYDNGNYMGSYVLIEKVEYGKNTMMSTATNGSTVKSLDSYNEDTAVAAGIDYDALVQTKSSVTVNGNSIEYKYSKFEKDGVDVYDQALTDYQNYDYVMEFELKERADNEASYFKTKDGQYICMKYPEFASKSEMEWFISEFIPAWDAVYASNYDGYKDIIDVDSFANTYLIQELSINLDSAATSYYVTGGKNFDKFVAAPLWDYDWAVGDYYKTKLTTSASVSMDNPEQMFVKYKSMNTGAGEVAQSTKCFEAALTQNASFWEICQYQWTNMFVPALTKYIDNSWIDGDKSGGYTDSKKLLTELLPQFESAQAMNEARWHQMSDLNNNGGSMSWGTKSTSTYNPKSYLTGMNIGNSKATGATSSYANTVYYLNDWLALRWNYMSESTKGNLWVPSMHNKVENVAFTATQNDDVLTINTITADAKQGDDFSQNISTSDLTVVVYNNGEAVNTFVLSDLASNNTVALSAGDNKITVEVYVTEHKDVAGTSKAQTFSVSETGAEVTLNIYFKSSSSYRYIPSVRVNGGDATKMTQSTLIGVNDTYTQNFYWYKATAKAKVGDSLSLVFVNTNNMKGAITVENVQLQDYYFGVDNLNNGTVAVDLSNKADVVKNFFMSAAHMVLNENLGDNNVSSGSLISTAYTNLGGRQLVLGDADADYTLSVVDASLIQQSLVEITELSDTASALSDFNLDEDVSITDATAIQFRLAGIR